MTSRGWTKGRDSGAEEEEEKQQLGHGWAEPALLVQGRRLVHNTQAFRPLCGQGCWLPENFTVVTSKEEGEQKRGTSFVLPVCAQSHP